MPLPERLLTWIHLSDLHFGHGPDATTRSEQELVTNAIQEDAIRVAAVYGRPDYVFVTGDVAFSATADQYAAAAAWFDALLKGLGLGPERLLVVPGNHDVNRKAWDPAGPVHKGYRAEPVRFLDLAFERPADLQLLWPKHAEYQRFAEAYKRSRITPGRPYWTARLDVADAPPVVAVGLNTTLLSFDGTDGPENLAIGGPQILRALKDLPSDALILLLQHHPPDWLVDGNQLLAALPRYAHVLFSGHVHRAGGFVHHPFGGRGSVQLVAGAGHADAGEAGEHAYAWGALHRKGLDYLPRVWLAEERRFDYRRVTAPLEERVHEHVDNLGVYTCVPGTALPPALRAWLTRRDGSGRSTPPRVEPPLFEPTGIGSPGIRPPSAERERAQELEAALSTLEKVKEAAARGSLREVWEAVDTPVPAPSDTPFHLAAWLGSVVVVLVIAIIVLVVAFQTGGATPRGWMAARNVIDFVQCGVVAVLLFFSVARGAPPRGLREPWPGSDICERGVAKFNRLWKLLWWCWLVNYLIYSGEHFVDWDGHRLAKTPYAAYAAWLEHDVIHFMNAMLFLLFWEMYRPMRGPVVKEGARTWSMQCWVVLVCGSLAAVEMLLVYLQQGRTPDPITASLWMGLLGGCISAVCLGLFVGRLESRFLDVHPIQVVVLYVYVSIQPLFSISQMERVITITEGLSLMSLQVVIKVLAIAFKLAMFFAVRAQLESGRLAFYLWKAQISGEDMPSEWAVFQRKRLT